MTIEERLQTEIDILFTGTPDERKAAAIKLGRIRDPRSVEALIMSAQTDTDKFTRIFSIQSLMWIGDDRAITALIDKGFNDKEKSVRISAIQAFATFKDSRIMKALEEMEKSLDSDIRESASQTLRIIIKSL